MVSTQNTAFPTNMFFVILGASWITNNISEVQNMSMICSSNLTILKTFGVGFVPKLNET